jgi:hypothetical protein
MLSFILSIFELHPEELARQARDGACMEDATTSSFVTGTTTPTDAGVSES